MKDLLLLGLATGIAALMYIVARLAVAEHEGKHHNEEHRDE